MSHTLSILMLGGAKRVSMAEHLVTAASHHGIDLKIYSHELDSCEPIASVGTVIVGNRYSSPSALDEITEIIRQYHIDVILPFIDPGIALARQAADATGIFSPTSSVELANALFDKVKSAALFESNGVPIPATYHTCEEARFPLILKPRCGSASHGIKVATCAEELAQITDIDTYLMQQYIANRDEYTLDCYIGTVDGEIKCIVPRIRIATVGGEVIKTRTCRSSKLIDLGKTVITRLGLRGAVTLQFIYDKATEQYLLMEINPRLGGGVICSISAGADIADMIITEAVGEKASLCDDWRDGTLMTRYMKEVIFYNDEQK